MPIIRVNSFNAPPSRKRYQLFSEQLAPIFKSPPQTIRFLWSQMQPESIYNWGELGGPKNRGPIIEVVFRDRLTKATIQSILRLVTKLMAEEHQCATAEVFVYTTKIKPGNICVLDQIWQGRKSFRKIR